MIEVLALTGHASTWKEALGLTARALHDAGCVKGTFLASCVERERRYPTGLTDACPVAIPHTTENQVLRDAVCVLRLDAPVQFQSIEDPSQPVQVRYVINLALRDGNEHLSFLRSLITGIKQSGFFERIDACPAEGLADWLSTTLFSDSHTER